MLDLNKIKSILKSQKETATMVPLPGGLEMWLEFNQPSAYTCPVVLKFLCKNLTPEELRECSTLYPGIDPFELVTGTLNRPAPLHFSVWDAGRLLCVGGIGPPSEQGLSTLWAIRHKDTVKNNKTALRIARMLVSVATSIPGTRYLWNYMSLSNRPGIKLVEALGAEFVNHDTGMRLFVINLDEKD